MRSEEQLLQMQMKSRLKAFRMHRIDAAGNESQPADVRRLMAVREEAERVRRESAALHACLQQIQGSLATVSGQVDQRLTEVTALAVELGLAVAREVVGDALDHRQADPTDAVRRCLEQVVAGGNEGSGGSLRVFLSSQDIGVVVNKLEGEGALVARRGSLDFQVDPNIAPGSVRVESEHGRLLYEPREVLERISASVRQQLSEPAEVTVESA